MHRQHTLALALLLAPWAAACDNDSPVAPNLPDGPVQVVALYAATNSGFVDSTRQVVRTETAFETAWEDVVGSIMPPPELPTVDFQRDMVLVVAQGERPQGCHSIQVTDAFGDGIDLTVTVTETEPTPSCGGCTQAVVQPVEVVRVPRADQVDFRTEIADNCPA
jgi:hypothetical protein